MAVLTACGIGYFASLWRMRFEEEGIVQLLSQTGPISVEYTEPKFFGLIPGRVYSASLWANKSVPEEPFRELLRFSKLKSVDLSFSNVGPGHFQLSERNDSIEKLIPFCCRNFDDAALRLCATNFMSLTYLNLHGTELSDLGGTSLGKLKQLKWLNVNGTGIGDDTMKEVLSQCNELEKLVASETDIGNEIIGPLFSHPTLKYVDISNTNIGAEVLASAKPPTGIKHLTHWSKTPISPSARDRFKTAFPNVGITMGPVRRE